LKPSPPRPPFTDLLDTTVLTTLLPLDAAAIHLREAIPAGLP
jgi:hypothetical protein